MNTLKTGSKTPWGKAQTVKTVIPGIISVTTAGHGGIKVAKALNDTIPVIARKADGWYEEDCEWAIVALCFPVAFTCSQKLAAATCKNYYPKAYTAITDKEVAPSESYTMRKAAFEAETANKFVAKSAVNAGIGMVKVWFFKASTGEERVAHIPAAIYDKAGEFGYVVEEIPS
jgi:hypothetical protein